MDHKQLPLTIESHCCVLYNSVSTKCTFKLIGPDCSSLFVSGSTEA